MILADALSQAILDFNKVKHVSHCVNREKYGKANVRSFRFANMMDCHQHVKGDERFFK